MLKTAKHILLSACATVALWAGPVFGETSTVIWSQEAFWVREDGREFAMYARVHDKTVNNAVDFLMYDPSCIRGRQGFKQQVNVNGIKVDTIVDCVNDEWMMMYPVEQSQGTVLKQFIKKLEVRMDISDTQMFVWNAKGVQKAINHD